MLEKLLSKEKNLQSFLNNITDGVTIIDMNRHIRFMNEKAKNILGYTDKEVIGIRCKKILKTQNCENNCPVTLAINLGKNVDNFETVYKGKNDRSIKAITNVSLFYNEKGDIIGAAEIFKDITEIKELEEQLYGKYSFENIVGKSKAMQEIYDLIREVAPSDATVLIQGESGTGKELIASAIQKYSTRHDRPFVKVNCAALAEGVLESELFGHVKGAFTGALKDSTGRFELADGGTIFLDEIGEISPSTQVKLLRILQENEFEKVGSNKTITIDVRVLASTNKNLKDEIKKGTFREDLYYRLHVIPIEIPPLRERKEDIPLLIDHFIKKLNRTYKEKYIEKISKETLDSLMEYDFPGNIRELENIIEYSYIRCRGNIITEENLPSDFKDPIREAITSKTPLETVEKEVIVSTLQKYDWKLQYAAKNLGMSRTTLWRKMKKLDIRKNNE